MVMLLLNTRVEKNKKSPYSALALLYLWYTLWFPGCQTCGGFEWRDVKILDSVNGNVAKDFRVSAPTITSRLES